MSPDASGQFAGEAVSAKRARALVREVMAAWDCDDLEEIASLLTTELVANAVRYARDRLDVRLVLGEGVFRAEVRDRNSLLPKRRAVEPDSRSGRGLILVESLASRWGADADESGKVVWFELPVGDRQRQ